MTLSEKQQAFSKDVIRLLIHINESGYQFTFGETWRSHEQAELYAKCGKGIVNSLHCQRMAIDINLFKDSVWLQAVSDHKPFADYWKSLSPMNRYGGDFKRVDSDHYERNDI